MLISPPQTVLEKILFAAPIVIGLTAIAGFMIDPVYGVWVDRDLLRATRIFEFFQVMGAELNGTYFARTPGGAYYYILAFLTLFSNDPVVLTRILIVLSVSGGVAVYIAAARLWGTIAGLVAAGLWFTSPLVLGAGFQIINPAVGLPISGFCYLMFVRYFQGEQNALPWLGVLLGILIQTHISFLALMMTFGIAIAILRRPRWREAAISVVGFIFTFLPYIVSEIMNGFVNTRLLILGRDEPNAIYTAIKFDSLEYFFIRITKPVIESGPIAVSSAIIVFGILFVFILLATKRVVSNTSAQRTASAADRVVIGLGIILLAGIILITVGRGFAVQHRYFVFLVPAIALLAGGVAASVVHWMHSGRPLAAKVGPALVALCLIALSGGHISETLTIWSKPGETQTRLTQLSSLIRAAKTYSGYSAEDINGRVVAIGTDGKLQEDFASYLALTVEAPDAKVVAIKPSCIAVIETPNPEQAARSYDIFMANMPFPPIGSTLLGQDTNYSVYAYRLENENCYKSMGNSYDHFAKEQFARDRCDEAKNDGTVWLEQNPQGLRAVIRDTFNQVRICFGIDYASVDGQLVGNLNSWQSRSYSGYPTDHWSFRNLDLQFSRNGQIISKPLLLAPLGRFKFSRMPWKFSVTAPPDGTYGLTLDYTLSYQDHADYTFEDNDKTAPLRKASYPMTKSVIIAGAVEK